MSGRKGDAVSAFNRPSQRLNGACSFTPEVTDECRLRLRSRTNDEAHLAVGAGELKFITTEPGMTTPDDVQRSGKTVPFSPEELRDLCQSIEFKQTPIVHDAKLVLLDISPRRAHAYWEIGQMRMTKLRMAYGNAIDRAVMVLRFYEVAYLHNEAILNQFDIDVAGMRHHHTNDFWESGKRYIAELGFRLPDDRFLRLARSNSIEMPTEATSTTSGIEYMFVERNQTLPQRPSLPALFCLADPEVESSLEPVDHPLRDIQAERHVRDVYRRVLSEGPRVLSNRPPIIPTPPKVREAEYQERRKRRQPTKEAPPQAMFSEPKHGDGIKDRNRLSSTNRQERSSSSSDRILLSDTPCSLKGVSLDLPSTRFGSTVTDPELPIQSITAAISASRAARPQEVTPQAEPTTSKAVPPPLPHGHQGGRASFLSGLGIPPIAEPARQAPITFHRPLPPSRTPVCSNWTTPTVEDFCAGIPLITEAEVVAQEAITHNAEFYEDPFLAGLNLVPVATPPRPAVTCTATTVSQRKRHTGPGYCPDAFGAGLEPSHPEQLFTDALPALASVAKSTEPHRPEKLMLQASLTLSGQAPEGTTLMLDGKELPVDASGTFTLTCAITDGVLTLPFTLTSETKPEQNSHTTVNLAVTQAVQHRVWDRVEIQ